MYGILYGSCRFLEMFMRSRRGMMTKIWANCGQCVEQKCLLFTNDFANLLLQLRVRGT